VGPCRQFLFGLDEAPCPARFGNFLTRSSEFFIFSSLVPGLLGVMFTSWSHLLEFGPSIHPHPATTLYPARPAPPCSSSLSLDLAVGPAGESPVPRRPLLLHPISPPLPSSFFGSSRSRRGGRRSRGRASPRGYAASAVGSLSSSRPIVPRVLRWPELLPIPPPPPTLPRCSVAAAPPGPRKALPPPRMDSVGPPIGPPVPPCRPEKEAIGPGLGR
jgi:hypothetical protein